jgi:hypothetical protein
VSDAPRYRLWPPIDVGVPLVLGLTLRRHWAIRCRCRTGSAVGWLLVRAFAVEQVGAGAHGRNRAVSWRADTVCVGPRAVPGVHNPLYLGLLAPRRIGSAVAVVQALVAVPSRRDCSSGAIFRSNI